MAKRKRSEFKSAATLTTGTRQLVNEENEELDREESGHPVEYSDGFDEDEDDGDQSDVSKQESDTGNGLSAADGKKSSKTSKMKVKVSQLADDLHNLQEAVQLYKSNIFKMEIDELLTELKIDEDKTKPVDRILHKLKESIEKIEDSSELLLSDAEKLISKSGISIPFPDPRPPQDAQYRFKYESPSDYNLVGCYLLKTMIKSPERFGVDVVLDMPKSIFHEKDTLNYRYFHKRAFYLAYIAAYLKSQKELPFELSYELLNGDHLRPVLRLDSLKDGGEFDFHRAKCYIRIIPSIDQDVFTLTKVLPSRNCVRYMQNPAESLNPTPYYNSSILNDTYLFPSTVFLHKAAKSCDGFKDAIKLGEIWLRQRGFDSSVDGGGFGSWEWGILMATLLQGGGTRGSRILSKGFSNYQLFKATLNYLASNDFTETPVSIAKEPLAFDMGVFGDGPVLVNNDINFNVLYRMSVSSYRRLRHEASLTVTELDDVKGDHFDSVFLDKVDSLIYQYDFAALIKIPLSRDDKVYREIGRVFNPSYYAYFASKVYRILHRGLGERASLISIKFSETSKWPLTAARPSSLGDGTFTLGLILDPEHSERLIVHGPSAEKTAQAEEFRKFWGKKSELRRFKDGSIIESVLWEQHSERSIVSQIIDYLLERHFGEATAKSMTIVGDGLAQMFAGDKELGEGSAFTNFQKNLDEFEFLRKLLIDINDLPLRVSSVMPASQALRYASIRSPAEFSITAVHDFSDVVIELETSSKWPDDLKAVQHSKAAFLIGIAESIKNIDAAILTQIGLDRDLATIESFSYLDILLPSGYAFRVRIQTEREAIMLRNYKPDQDLGRRAHRNFERNFSLAARHTTEFHTMCHRFPFLSPTVRRVKKWFHSHYLSPHVDDVLIELVTLSMFLKPFPWTAPASATTGFLRTLYFLAHWDWRAEPLILDVDNTLTIGDIQSIRDTFKSLRINDPECAQTAMFVAVNYEQSGTMWTSPNPSKVIASRITALARASCGVLKTGNAIVSNDKSAAGRIFVSHLMDFDFIIHLKTMNGQAGHELSYPPRMESLCDYVGLYCDELQTIFDGNVLLFRNVLKNDVIAGVWDPRILTARNWKVYLGYSAQPCSTEAANADNKSVLVKANILAMVREMERLGGDLVSKVEVLK
ncbi:Nrap protein [Lipomyces doorenjongii]|uniref:Nrap protein n=1 Tax=Lipomyces doorenjongii TaxID=383834 RepID=UPI0034CF9733